MKIGIMGGTFNPIHNGHLMLAEFAYHAYGLDEIWFLPNGNPPHKDSSILLNNTDDRKDMVLLAIEGTPYFKLCDYEMQRTDKSYSYETMEHLKSLHPDDDFYFIVGADSLFSLEHWKHPERLLKIVTILAAYRDNVDTDVSMYEKISRLKELFDCDIRLLHTPILPVSSREIRQEVATRGYEVLKELPIPDIVATYIAEHSLYMEA